MKTRLNKGVSLPCSRMRRKAAALDGMPRCAQPLWYRSRCSLTQPGPAGRLRLLVLILQAGAFSQGSMAETATAVARNGLLIDTHIDVPYRREEEW